VCWSYDIGVIPYSPLGGGFLTGKYRRGGDEVESARAGGASRYFTDRNWDLLDRMEEIANAHNGSISQVALAWQIANPVITSPIIGPRNQDKLQDNLGAVEMELSEEENKILS
jgi:aryl-alcohol dehydrogenase-like predicted oxidoreductase